MLLQGACAIYDPNMLRQRAHFIYSLIRLFSIVSDLFVVYHAKGLNLLEEEKEEEKQESSVDKGFENIPL